jgi:SAM-dependent methyltransferase
MAPPTTTQGWDERYRTGDLPWDCGVESPELLDVLREQKFRAGRALELGCGAGTNVVAMAKLGFNVVGVDCSPRALEMARDRAAKAGVAVEFVEGDVCNLPRIGEGFDWIFDRGCYHCVRSSNLEGYLKSVQRNCREGALLLILAGNADDPNPGGPPKVDSQQIQEELGRLGRIERLRAFHFTDAGGVQGPLGWSCLVRRTITDVDSRTK